MVKGNRGLNDGSSKNAYLKLIVGLCLRWSTFDNSSSVILRAWQVSGPIRPARPVNTVVFLLSHADFDCRILVRTNLSRIAAFIHRIALFDATL